MDKIYLLEIILWQEEEEEEEEHQIVMTIKLLLCMFMTFDISENDKGHLKALINLMNDRHHNEIALPLNSAMSSQNSL